MLGNSERRHKRTKASETTHNSKRRQDRRKALEKEARAINKPTDTDNNFDMSYLSQWDNNLGRNVVKTNNMEGTRWDR